MASFSRCHSAARTERSRCGEPATHNLRRGQGLNLIRCRQCAPRHPATPRKKLSLKRLRPNIFAPLCPSADKKTLFGYSYSVVFHLLKGIPYSSSASSLHTSILSWRWSFVQRSPSYTYRYAPTSGRSSSMTKTLPLCFDLSFMRGQLLGYNRCCPGTASLHLPFLSTSKCIWGLSPWLFRKSIRNFLVPSLDMNIGSPLLLVMTL